MMPWGNVAGFDEIIEPSRFLHRRSAGLLRRHLLRLLSGDGQ